MPTVRWELRNAAHRYFYRSLERFGFNEMLSTFKTIIMMQFALMVQRRRSGTLTPRYRKARIISMIACVFYMKLLSQRLGRKFHFTLYPSVGVQQHAADSDFWSEQLFDEMFRFRKQHFFRVLDAMQLRGKIVRC